MPPPPDLVQEVQSPSVVASKGSAYSSRVGSIAASVVSGTSFSVAASDVLTGSAPPLEVPAVRSTPPAQNGTWFSPDQLHLQHSQYTPDNNASTAGSVISFSACDDGQSSNV